MAPIITELYRHAMYHDLHVTEHFVTCCKQDQSKLKCASSNVHAMCELAQSGSNSRYFACYAACLIQKHMS